MMYLSSQNGRRVAGIQSHGRKIKASNSNRKSPHDTTLTRPLHQYRESVPCGTLSPSIRRRDSSTILL